MRAKVIRILRMFEKKTREKKGVIYITIKYATVVPFKKRVHLY